MPAASTQSSMRPCCQDGSLPDALLLLFMLLLLRGAACGLPQWAATVRGGCCEPVKGRALLQPARRCIDACMPIASEVSDLLAVLDRGQGIDLQGGVDLELPRETHRSTRYAPTVGSKSQVTKHAQSASESLC